MRIQHTYENRFLHKLCPYYLKGMSGLTIGVGTPSCDKCEHCNSSYDINSIECSYDKFKEPESLYLAIM